MGVLREHQEEMTSEKWKRGMMGVVCRGKKNNILGRENSVFKALGEGHKEDNL